MPAAAAPKTRQYRSPLRQRRTAETRAAALDAAERLFTERGWAATGMREIAAEAGVSTETLYARFGSKRALLHAVMDVSVMGDAEPVALADRPEFAAIANGSHRTRAATTARLVTEICRRTAAMNRVIREAAASDPEMAEMLHETRERRRRDTEAGVALLLGRAPTASERDGVWAITGPEVYDLLVERSGWTPAEYERWISSTLELLARPSKRTGGKDPT